MDNNKGLASFLGVERAAQIKSQELVVVEKRGEEAAVAVCDWAMQPRMSIVYPSLQEAVEAFERWGPATNTKTYFDTANR